MHSISLYSETLSPQSLGDMSTESSVDHATRSRIDIRIDRSELPRHLQHVFDKMNRPNSGDFDYHVTLETFGRPRGTKYFNAKVQEMGKYGFIFAIGVKIIYVNYGDVIEMTHSGITPRVGWYPGKYLSLLSD